MLRAHSIQVIEISAGLITGIHVWIDPGLLAGFGLPGQLGVPPAAVPR